MVELHPFISQHPTAVFVLRTRLRERQDIQGMLEAGRAATTVIFRKASSVGAKRRVVIKPNITTRPEIDPQTNLPVPGQEGVVTSPHFVAGFIDGIRGIDDAPLSVAEGTEPYAVVARGYDAVLRERGVQFYNLNTPLFTETDHPDTGVNWHRLDGVVFKDIPFVKPIGDTDVFHVNMPKMKTHNLAVTTLSIKNTQGTVALNYFRPFCTGLDPVRHLPAHIKAHFQPDVVERIKALWQAHLRAGYLRWEFGGTRDEVYAQKAVDALDGVRPDLHVLEGCTIRNGSGFRHGLDLLANYVIFGLSHLPVDAVGTWVMGHNPRNIGLYRVAHERGKGENDPARIEVFLVTADGFKPVDYREFERVPAGVHYHADPSRLIFF